MRQDAGFAGGPGCQAQFDVAAVARPFEADPEQRVVGVGAAAIRATARLHRASTTTVTAISRTLKRTVQEDRQECIAG